jgi:hypothetical protein
MIAEYELGTYTEDDRIKELPEKYKRMTPEEREAEMERLYKEMKENPLKTNKDFHEGPNGIIFY